MRGRLPKGGLPHLLGRVGGLLNVIEGVQDQPGLGEGAHEVPEARAPEAILRDEAQLGVHASGVLEPDLVFRPPGVGVVEEGGLGGLVVLDGRAVLDGQLDGPLVGDGLGPGLPPDEGQGPVIAVVGHAQEDFLRRDFRDGVVQHRPDVGQGGHGERRAVGVAPLVCIQ